VITLTRGERGNDNEGGNASRYTEGKLAKVVWVLCSKIMVGLRDCVMRGRGAAE